MKHNRIKNKISSKIVRVTLLSILVLLIFTTTFTYYSLTSALDKRMIEVADGTLKAVEKRFNEDTLAAILKADSELSESYLSIKSNLMIIRDASSIEYLHIVVKTDDGYAYLVDGLTEDEDTAGYLEPIEPEYTSFYDEVYATKKPLYGEFENYEDMVLFTNYFPILNNQNQVVALLGTDFNVTNEVADTYQTFMVIVIFTAIALLIIGLMLTLIINRSLKPIQALAEDCNKLAEYDLSNPINTNYKGEFKLLAEALSALQANNKLLISKVQNISNNISHNFVSVQESSHTISGMIQETTAALGETSENISDQVNNMIQLTQDSHTLSNHVSDMSSAISTAINDGNDVKKSTEISSKQMGHMKAQFIETEVGFNTLNQKMNDLFEKSGAILGIIETIRSIADQTNLLALNASIEAARAGEQGRGFAVVAEEIRKLAEESGQSVSEIDSIIKSVLNEIKASNEITSSNHELILKSNREIEDTIKQYESTEQFINAILFNVSSLDSKIESILKLQKNVLEKTDVVNSISNKNASNIEGIGAASQEESANVEEITASIDALNEMMQELNNQINLYKL